MVGRVGMNSEEGEEGGDEDDARGGDDVVVRGGSEGRVEGVEVERGWGGEEG